MTARKKIDVLIDDAATMDYEGMTKLERDLALSDVTLAGLRVLAKAIDNVDAHLDEIDVRLDKITRRVDRLDTSKDREAGLDVIVGGLGYLRKRVKKLTNKKRR